jgi:hypothetical protein
VPQGGRRGQHLRHGQLPPSTVVHAVEVVIHASQ